MTSEDLVYTAGFLDADGSVSALLVRKKYPKLTVQVTGKSKVVIQWLHETFGGHIYIEAHKNRPSIYYKWMIIGTAASKFLESVLPFLKLKAEQARLGIELESYKRPKYGSRGLGMLKPERQLEIREAIMRLNRES